MSPLVPSRFWPSMNHISASNFLLKWTFSESTPCHGGLWLLLHGETSSSRSEELLFFLQGLSLSFQRKEKSFCSQGPQTFWIFQNSYLLSTWMCSRYVPNGQKCHCMPSIREVLRQSEWGADRHPSVVRTHWTVSMPMVGQLAQLPGEEILVEGGLVWLTHSLPVIGTSECAGYAMNFFYGY